MSSADALGYRAKIGLLVPFTNTIVQPECDSMRPVGVTNHVARMEPSTRAAAAGDMDAYRRSLDRGSEHIVAALRQVLPARPDIVVLGHSIDTFRGGLRGAEHLRDELARHADGVPVILPSHAFLAALDALNVGRRVAALTPYWPPGDDQVRSFFEDAGYQVGSVIGLRCPDPLAIAATPAERILDALRALSAERPDVIVQPGTNLATAALAADAGRSLGVPVVACNTATYWHALRTLAIGDRVAGFGPLLAEH